MTRAFNVHLAHTNLFKVKWNGFLCGKKPHHSLRDGTVEESDCIGNVCSVFLIGDVICITILALDSGLYMCSISNPLLNV